MDDSFEIALSEQETGASGAVQLPVNFLTVGEIETDDVKVYIHQEVFKALETYALADTAHERGTILLGDFHEELGKTFVVISNYIEARYTDASASTLTFTHETWDYVHREQDQKYPDKKIVGWQHTHPNYGIFLSNYDLFIHEYFFNLPFQLAYVIDPIQNLRGFFQWKHGKIEKLSGFYIYDDVGTPVKIKQTRDKPVPEPQKKSGRAMKAALALALLVAAGSLLAAVHLKDVVRRQRETIEAQQTILDDQQARIDALTAPPATAPAQQKQTDADYIRYTVRPGDSLNRICADLGIDYWQHRSEILELNHIRDENVILTGQVLLFLPHMVADAG